jgi:nucleoid DNA-binding protein
VRYSPERPARNFRTGKPIMIPARYKVIFQASPQLLKEIKGKQETK